MTFQAHHFDDGRPYRPTLPCVSWKLAIRGAIDRLESLFRDLAGFDDEDVLCRECQARLAHQRSGRWAQLLQYWRAPMSHIIERSILACRNRSRHLILVVDSVLHPAERALLILCGQSGYSFDAALQGQPDEPDFPAMVNAANRLALADVLFTSTPPSWDGFESLLSFLVSRYGRLTVIFDDDPITTIKAHPDSQPTPPGLSRLERITLVHPVALLWPRSPISTNGLKPCSSWN